MYVVMNCLLLSLEFLPPAYVVRREGNVLTRVCPSICLSTGGGVPISHNALQHFPECHAADTGGGYPARSSWGVPCSGVTLPGPARGSTLPGPARGSTLPGPARGTLPGGVPCQVQLGGWGTLPGPARGGTLLGGYPAGGVPS